MAKKYGCYAEDMIEMAKEMLISEIRNDLREYEKGDDAHGLIIGLTGKMIMTDRFIEELMTEKDDDR